MSDDWWEPGPLAEWLKMSERTLANWRHFNTGPRYYHIGRHVRYRHADVEEWLAGLMSDP